MKIWGQADILIKKEDLVEMETEEANRYCGTPRKITIIARNATLLERNINCRCTCATNYIKNQVEIPRRYIINKNAAILFWKDNTKTIVKRSPNDEYNKRLAFLTAYFQKHCGLSKTKANEYLDSLVDEEEKQIIKALQEGTLIKDVGQVIENVGNSISNYGKKLKGENEN